MAHKPRELKLPPRPVPTKSSAKALPFAQWLNALTMARKQADDPDFDGCEEMLAYIHVEEVFNHPVKITDLVQCMFFGTGPTVQRKVMTLANRGFINVSISKNDKRAKQLTLTKAGTNLLHERSKQMAQVLELS